MGYLQTKRGGGDVNDKERQRFQGIRRMLEAGMFPVKAITALTWLADMVEKLDVIVTALRESAEDLARYDSLGER